MGFGSSKEKKQKENQIISEDLINLLDKSIEKCIHYCKEIEHKKEQKKNELVDLLKKKQITTAKTTMGNILQDEDQIDIYNIITIILDDIKGKCDFKSDNECPLEIKNNLNVITFASNQLKIDELKSFKKKIIKKYGNKCTINPENNPEQSIKEEDLLKKFNPKVFPEEKIISRLKQLCQEKNIESSSLNDSISEEDLLRNDLDLNKINPYEVDIQIDNGLNNFPMPAQTQGEKTNTNINIQNSNKKEDLDINSDKVFTEITSNVNGFYCKTKVTQKFSNPLDNPLELKIYIPKKENIIFSSFDCQIGDSIKVKSKVIKQEKAEEKYVDSISSGNAAIFVYFDKDKNMIAINMGNIPLKAHIIFNSYFISPIETYNNAYEFELFRNLPIFIGKSAEIYQNCELNGEVIIKSNNEIININKNILMKDLKISEEKLISKNPYTFILKYKIDNLPYFKWNDSEYIPCSKIYFDLDTNQPLALAQEKDKESNEKYYCIQHRFKLEQLNKDDQEMNPSLFIFLLDQSGSMSGSSMIIARKALILFLQSIPVGSYYQIIGFGSKFKKYDEIPKEYNKDNIKTSINTIQKLEAVLGGTNIYAPLKNIFDSKDYDNIDLPRNIFLLTDGDVENEKEVLDLIEANNSKFKIYSIGIGQYFDEHLIKNAGIIGKGNYNFCKDLKKLNSIIASEINKCCNPFVTDIKINCNLDIKNTITNVIPNIKRENEIINLYYIIEENNIQNKIQLTMKYKDNKKLEYEKNYEINPVILDKGDDLSKLIVCNHIRKDYNLPQEEKIKLALKYQIFIEGTSLFAEIELNEKISSEMQLNILGEKDTNTNIILQKKQEINFKESNYTFGGSIFGSDPLGCSNNMKMNIDDLEPLNECCCEKNEDFNDIFGNLKEDDDINNCNKSNNNKPEDEFMEMVNTQDFIEGFWEENDKTKKIIEKYEKEYQLIKEIKDKNIDEKTAITILIVYYINKEHSELLNDLLMVIKKAKMFIQKITNDSYENIIKEVNIN